MIPTVGAGWPQGFVWPERGEILAEGFQGLLYGPERGLWQLSPPVFANLAPVAVADRFSLLAQVAGLEVEHFSATPPGKG